MINKYSEGKNNDCKGAAIFFLGSVYREYILVLPVAFSRTSLPIGKETGVVTLERLAEQRLSQTCVHLLLGHVFRVIGVERGEGEVVQETVLNTAL